MAQADLRDVQTTFNNGVELKSQKKYNEALRAFAAAIESIAQIDNETATQSLLGEAKKQVVNLHILITNDYYLQKDFENAIKSLEEAKNVAEGYEDTLHLKYIETALPNLFYDRGLESMSLKNYPDALQDFDRALGLAPQLSKVMLAVGVAYQQLGNTDRALQAYEETIQLAAKDNYLGNAKEACKAAVSYLLAEGQKAKDKKYYEGAYKHFTRALKFDEKNGELYLQTAIVANQLEKYKEAIDAALQGLEVEKRSAQLIKLNYQLAFAYEASKTTHKACDGYQKVVLAIDDTDRQNARDAIRRLRCK
ncbi:peptide transporter [Bacteroidia bacterium]|nr:peptide transporter [Bacteroidia bacterium]